MSDLNDRIARWRVGLEATDALSDESLDELESHLRDEHEALQDLGLSDDEAFLVAARRLGRGEQLDAEFAKVAPHAGWGRRSQVLLVGAGLGLLGVQLVKAVGHVGAALALDQRNHWAQQAYGLGGALLGLALVVWLARLVLRRGGSWASSVTGRLRAWRGARWGTARVALVVLSATLVVQAFTFVTKVWSTSALTTNLSAADFGQARQQMLLSELLLAGLAPTLLVLMALRGGARRETA